MTESSKYSPANKAMSDVLEGARGKARISVAKLSELSGVPYGTLVKILNNRTAIDVNHIAYLAPALNRTPKSLMDEATEDLGGMEALISDAEARTAKNTPVARPVSEGQGTNVTPLHRKRNDQLSAEEIDAGKEDRAALEIDEESDRPEDSN